MPKLEKKIGPLLVSARCHADAARDEAPNKSILANLSWNLIYRCNLVGQSARSRMKNSRVDRERGEFPPQPSGIAQT